MKKQELVAIIEAYMKKHNLDQKRMAERLDIAESTLSTWLNPDKKGITKRNLARVKFFCADVLPEIYQGRDIFTVNNGNNNTIENDSRNIFFNDTNASAIIADCRSRLITALIESDIEPVALKQVLQIVNKVMEGKK